VHEDGRIQPDDILIEQHHRVPPVLPDIVLQFNAILAIIINRGQSVIDLAGGKYISVLLAMCNQFLEEFLLRHKITYIN